MQKLIEAGADVTAIDSQGNSALSAVLLALPAGFQMLSPDSGFGTAPMVKIANALLTACSKVGTIPNYVVHRAAHVGRTDVIDLLVKHFGVDVARQQSRDSMTPLHYAVQAQQLQVCSLVIYCSSSAIGV